MEHHLPYEITQPPDGGKCALI